MNLTERKFYIYSQNGLLMKRYTYQDFVKKLGNPVKISPNGQNFIF